MEDTKTDSFNKIHVKPHTFSNTLESLKLYVVLFYFFCKGGFINVFKNYICISMHLCYLGICIFA